LPGSAATAASSRLRRRPKQRVRETQAMLDPWSPGGQEILGSQLFAASLFPYLGFLWTLNQARTKYPESTGVTTQLVFAFTFLLVFVFATIPAGIYAKTHYGTALANVDWLHGSAESLLTVTNLLIALALRDVLRKAKQHQQQLDD